MVRQLCIELALCGAVEPNPLELTVSVALIGIKESGAPGMSETVLRGTFLWKTHRNPWAEYVASARPIRNAEADLPMPRSNIGGMGTIETFMMLPVYIIVFLVSLGSVSHPLTACCAAT
jgi:hypothetical protein